MLESVCFRFEWKVKSQQDAANAELAERRLLASDIVEILDWLRAAEIKLNAMPLIGREVCSSYIQQSVQDHQVRFT